ncbi:hypothetical protein PGTUg99_009603 [Puccinia graminis f. sp. tritici]|uniref:Uncharacterized protein n=1 Tax=Puccinia graminis f. sp. tritici TaxID=56615 RepID=A0A5B0PG61_PUCGR|nr:hypothetical protein PGTUg99_009603 [Puccinia graminis f. sp. tritici]
MLVTIPFSSLIALVSCASILSAPGAVQDSSRSTLLQRQVSPATQNGMKASTPGAGNAPMKTVGVQISNNGSPVELTELQKENLEQAEENKPGLNTMANALNELYFHDKYGSQKHDQAMLLKMVGQAAESTGKTGDPEAVSRAMLATFGPYNQGKPSKISASPIAPLTKTTAAMDESPSLKTVAHSLHEAWEKSLTSNPKLDNAQLVPVICSAIATSATSGDPVAVSKAIDAAYAKIAGTQ